MLHILSGGKKSKRNYIILKKFHDFTIRCCWLIFRSWHWASRTRLHNTSVFQQRKCGEERPACNAFARHGASYNTLSILRCWSCTVPGNMILLCGHGVTKTPKQFNGHLYKDANSRVQTTLTRPISLIPLPESVHTPETLYFLGEYFPWKQRGKEKDNFLTQNAAESS